MSTDPLVDLELELEVESQLEPQSKCEALR